MCLKSTGFMIIYWLQAPADGDPEQTTQKEKVSKHKSWSVWNQTYTTTHHVGPGVLLLVSSSPAEVWSH